MASVNQGFNVNRIVTGAMGYLAFNGIGVGLVENIQASFGYQQQPVNVIDDMITLGHVATAYNVTNLSVSMLHLVERDLITAGIQPPLSGIYESPEGVLEIKDRPSDKAIWTFEGVKFQTTNFSFAKGVLSSDQVSFVSTLCRYTGGRA